MQPGHFHRELDTLQVEEPESLDLTPNDHGSITANYHLFERAGNNFICIQDRAIKINHSIDNCLNSTEMQKEELNRNF